MEKKQVHGRHWQACDVDEMAEVIDAYFEKCKGTMVINEKTGDPLTYKGEIVYKDKTPPSIVGLHLALGYNSTDAITKRIRVAERDDRDDPIAELLKVAMLRIEEETVRACYTREGYQGARMQLINKYGYQDKKQYEAKLDSGKVITETDARQALEALGYMKVDKRKLPREKKAEEVPEKPKRPKGRPRIHPIEPDKPKRPRGRPRKDAE